MKAKEPTITVCQYSVPGASKETLEKIEEICQRYSAKSDIVLLPEYCAGTTEDIKKGFNAFEEVKELAKKYRIHLSGAVIRKEDSRLYNVGFLISDEGKPILEYKKIYLAPPEYEQDGISTGRTLRIATTKFGKTSVLICKDTFNKYSEGLFLALRDVQSDIVLVPTWSLFWEERNTIDYIRNSLIRGSYLTNAYFFVSGNLNEETGSFGHSMVINPRDGLIREGGRDKEEFLTERVSFGLLKRVRSFDQRWQPKKRLKFAV